MFGGNVASLSSDEWTTALLTNEELMAVNQDASGTHGKRVAQQGSAEVWTRDLSGGRKAVALFNRIGHLKSSSASVRFPSASMNTAEPRISTLRANRMHRRR